MLKNNFQQAELSFWERDAFFEGFDIVVIGSGIVGLNAAISIKIKQPKWKIAIVERGTLPVGASTRNAGVACFGSMTELIDDLSHTPEDEVFALVERRWRGLRQLRERIGEQNMHYEELGGYELFMPNEAAVFQTCSDRLRDFNQHIERITGEKEVFRISDEKINTFGFNGVSHLIENRIEGQIHSGFTLKKLIALAEQHGITIFTGLNIEKIEDLGEKVRLETAQGWDIFAPKVLVCTNGFARYLFPELAVKPARNQVIVTQHIHNLKIKGAFHYDRGYFYFRNIGQRVLMGGGRNLDFETEFTDQFGHTDLIQNAISHLMKNVVLPSQTYEIDLQWSGIMGLGTQKKPIIQMLSTNVGVAVRMGGMGVAIGTLVGEEGAEMMCT